MIIKSAKFIVSNTKVALCPTHDLPEYAFIGRSNVGKSSLINMLTNNKYLAKTSTTPGKTQLINHFLINDSWYLVDLPGFGYAKTSKTNRNKWEGFIADYFKNRQELVSAFVLIDSRHEPQKIDLEFMEWLGGNQIPFAMAFTKIDKLSSTVLQKNLLHYQQVMLKTWEEVPPVFMTSSSVSFGKTELLNYIDSINKSLQPHD